MDKQGFFDILSLSSHNKYHIVSYIGKYQSGWLFSELLYKLKTLFGNTVDEYVRYGHKDLIKMFCMIDKVRITNSAVCVASACNNMQMLQYIAETYNLKKHKYAIENAIIFGNVGIIEYLEKNGNKFNIMDQLDRAVQFNNIKTVKWMIKHGYNRCSTNAFILCAENKYYDMLNFLALNSKKLKVTKSRF